MSTYKDQNLFSSGPHAFRSHGFTLRHDLLETSGEDGARVVPLGKSARQVTLAGSLYGDTPAQLQQLIEALEAVMDGLGGELVDNLNRTFPRMVLTELSLSRIQPTGSRHRVNYSMLYIQTNPDPAPTPDPIPIPDPGPIPPPLPPIPPPLPTLPGGGGLP